GGSGCQKTSLGGLEGRSPPNAIRIRRHVRRIRKPCAARSPYGGSRPGAPWGREGNGVNLGKGRRRRTFSAHSPLLHRGCSGAFFVFGQGPRKAPRGERNARRHSQ